MLVENILKNYKLLIQVIVEAKVILKMAQKIIYYSSQCKDILKGLLVLVVVIIFIFGILQACLMKRLNLLLHLITLSLQKQFIMVIKQK